MEKKRKKTKRSEVKYPGLVKEVNPKPRWEHIDFDYINKLSSEEKEFLSNFNEEYLSGNFQHEGKKHHNTKKEKKQCYDRNNARNRDIYSINRTAGWVTTPNLGAAIDELNRAKLNPNSTEDTIIALIDIKDKIKKN